MMKNLMKMGVIRGIFGGIYTIVPPRFLLQNKENSFLIGEGAKESKNDQVTVTIGRGSFNDIVIKDLGNFFLFFFLEFSKKFPKFMQKFCGKEFTGKILFIYGMRGA
jgi:hypothetical protein